MITSLPQRPLGTFLVPERRPVDVDPGGEYRMMGVYSFGRGVFSRGKIKGIETKYRQLYEVRGGDLVVSRLKAFEGAVAVVVDDLNGSCVSAEFPTFSASRSLCSRYLHHLCSWPGLWEQFASASRGLGSRRERISVDTVLGARVPLPDRDHQERIASRVDRYLSRLEHLRESSVESLVASLLRSAFPDDLPMLLAGEVLELERDALHIEPLAMYTQIGIRSFGNGIFHRPPTAGTALSKLNYFHIYPGRIILSNIMAWEGAVAVSEPTEQGTVGSHRFLSYRPKANLDLRYVNYYFQSERGRELLRAGSTGTIKRNQTLSPRAIERFRIPVPDVDVQRRVADTLDIAFGRLSSAYDKRRQLAEAMRPAVLNAAFSGEW